MINKRYKNPLLTGIRQSHFINTQLPQFIAKAPHSRVGISVNVDVELKPHGFSPKISSLKVCLPGTLLYMIES